MSAQISRFRSLSRALRDTKLDDIIDRILIALVLSKVFILDFLGYGGIAGLLAVILIAYRLCFGGWRIPLPLYVLVALGAVLTALSYLSGIQNPHIAQYNISSITLPVLYVAYFALLSEMNPEAIDLKRSGVTTFFNLIYFVNVFVMLRQVFVPYSIVAAAPEGGEIGFYQDLISGLFMYASTHAVTYYSVFVALQNLNEFHQSNGYRKAVYAIVFVLVVLTTLWIATLNDNKACYVFLPIGVALFYAQGLTAPQLMRVAKVLVLGVAVVTLLVLLYVQVPQFAESVDENLFVVFDIVQTSRGAGSSVEGSGERIAIIQYALQLPSTWCFGLGSGTATLQQPYFEGFQHFGQADFGSIVILFGAWFFVLLTTLYIYLLSRDITGPRKYVLATSLTIFVVVSSVYAQCFSRLNNVICLILVCRALADRWHQVARQASMEKGLTS